MAITYINFVPSIITAPQFNVTLDGATYTAIISWNLQGQRYYLNLYSLDGVLIVSKALIGSPIGFPVASATWKNGKVTLKTLRPHGLASNATVRLVISGMTPDGYNGDYYCFVTGPSEITYMVATDPGAVTVTGSVDQNINLVAGYFTESTFVYRTANNQFEVGP